MDVKLSIPEYTGDAFQFDWEDGFEIEAKIKGNEVVISANKAGLLSLAKHLIALSQDAIPKNYHIHLDEYNSLEEGSSELIFERK